MKLEGLQTLPSDWEGTSNHVLQLPHFMDEETEGWSGNVVSPRYPAGITAVLQMKAHILLFTSSGNSTLLLCSHL